MDNVHNVGDALSAGAVVGIFMGYLPDIAALFSIIWTAIRFYEWLRDRKLPKEDDDD